MSKNVAAAVAVALVTTSMALAAATAPTTQPAPGQGSAPVARPGRTVLLMTSQQMAADVSRARFWARWSCVLAGLALVGVLWVGWSMRTLARNQIDMARMIQALGTAQAD
jgi:hypothetical protein